MTERTLLYLTHPSFSFTDFIVNILLFIACLVFTIALFMTVFYTNVDDVAGYWVFAIGWMGVVFIQFAWYANPINLIALLLMNKNPLWALLLSCLALFLATTAFQISIIPTGFQHNSKIYIKEYGLGFLLWYFAHGCCLAALLLRWLYSLKK